MLQLQQPPQQVRLDKQPRQTLREPRGRIRDEQGGTFRLLCGVHLDYGPQGCDCDSCFFWEEERQAALSQGKPDRGPNPNHRCESYDDYTNPHGTAMGGYIARCYHEKVTPIPREQYKNDIITSKFDLDRRHNGPRPDMKKFARIDGSPTLSQPVQAAPPTPFPLKEMTLGQLLAVAAEEEIDLSTARKDKQGAINKEDVLRLIETSGKYA